MRTFSRKELDQVSANALSWEQEDVARAKRSVTLAWSVAGVASLLAVAGVAAVAVLAPLKTVEPYVVRVDRATGETSVLPAMTGANPLTHDMSVRRYFIAQYIRYREGWVPLAENEMYHNVALMSGPDERLRWQQFFALSNPESPQSTYKATPMVGVTIRSISFLADQVAEVHFYRTVYSLQGDARTASFIATMTFAITNRPAMASDRTVNPIGFTVTNYQVSPEINQ